MPQSPARWPRPSNRPWGFADGHRPLHDVTARRGPLAHVRLGLRGAEGPRQDAARRGRRDRRVHRGAHALGVADGRDEHPGTAAHRAGRAGRVYRALGHRRGALPAHGQRRQHHARPRRHGRRPRGDDAGACRGRNAAGGSGERGKGAVMREPDLIGLAGRAWKGTIAPEVQAEWPAALDIWLVLAPGAHPVWRWYIVTGCSLRDVPGVPPAKKRTEASTHELSIIALNPRYTPDD